MKMLKWAAIFAAAIVLPYIIVRKVKLARVRNDENIRYDIDDYMADQGL